MGVCFEIFTDPAPQGSKTIVPTARGWRTKESSSAVKPFREAVRSSAIEAFDGTALMLGPVALTVICQQRRPAAHYGTGRNAGKLKRSAPNWKTTAPDIDKITRAVADALAGIAYRNDAQICRLLALDQYVPEESYAPRVFVRVEELRDER